jgi:hypothetical protein
LEFSTLTTSNRSTSQVEARFALAVQTCTIKDWGHGVAGQVAKASRHHQPVKCAQKNSRLRTEAGCLIYYENLSSQNTFCHSKRDGQ